MAKEYFGLGDFAREETNFLNLIEEKAEEIAGLVSTLDTEEAIEQEAHLEAINFITDHAYDIIYKNTIKALLSSVEYNHELFVERTLAAIGYNKEELLNVESFTPGQVTVKFNLHFFGDIEEYVAAVEAARETLNIAKIPDIDVRSDIWKEKIYGVAREGKSITKETKSGSEDITDRYEGLWERTIETRLSFREAYHAPWMHIVNFGNIVYGEGEGGTP